MYRWVWCKATMRTQHKQEVKKKEKWVGPRWCSLSAHHQFHQAALEIQVDNFFLHQSSNCCVLLLWQGKVIAYIWRWLSQLKELEVESRKRIGISSFTRVASSPYPSRSDTKFDGHAYFLFQNQNSSATFICSYTTRRNLPTVRGFHFLDQKGFHFIWLKCFDHEVVRGLLGSSISTRLSSYKITLTYICVSDIIIMSVSRWIYEFDMWI